MSRILILADDLSGAADCGVACVRNGSATLVVLGDPGGAAQSEIVAVDTDTRRMPPAAATAKIDRLVRACAQDAELILFKKVDSTLRGNIAVELAATLQAHRSLHASLTPTIAVMAPAFPATGRTTVNGVQLVHGRPVHESHIGQLHGMSGRSFIPDLLHEAGLTTALLPLDIVRSGDQALAEAMSSLAPGIDVLVCDAEIDSDLRIIASASSELARNIIWVGSAGLAWHLPLAGGPFIATTVVANTLPSLSGSLLFVIGSLSRNSIEQVCVLTTSASALHIEVPPDVLLAGAGSSRWCTYERQLWHAIQANRDVVIGPALGPHVNRSEGPQLSAALAQITSSISDKVGALIAAGGETARMVLENWGVTRLRLIGELEKGVPLSITENWSRPLAVITKAGDFGKPETLFNCSQLLHRKDAPDCFNHHAGKGSL